MASPRSLISTTPFARLAVAAGVLVAGSAALRDGDVRACTGGDPTIALETTFDPAVIGDATWPGLFFDGNVAGYGDRCDACLTKAIAADWRGYLGPAVTDADWAHVLYELKSADLDAVAARLAGKAKTVPAGMEKTSIWSKSAPVDKLRAAVAFVQLARRVEEVDSFDGGYAESGQPKVAPLPAPELLAAAKAGLAAVPAADAFLRQRYAFQILRVTFYRREYAAVEKQFDTSAPTLLAPSQDLAFRARYYYAGALRHDDKRARANVELARIAADDPALAGYAMRDFQPMEDGDWKKALALATTTRDKTALWRLVGIKADPLAAVREIIKLDPKSNLASLLVVRELARIESASSSVGLYGQKVEPAQLAAAKAAYKTLEQLATTLAAAPGTDQPWVMELVIGHIAARRGDVAAARAHIQKALAARPGDPRVVAQGKASLALALVFDWKINPAHEDELAKLMLAVEATKSYDRQEAVHEEVRGRLAKAYLAAGKLVDAEMLDPNTLVPLDEYSSRPTANPYDRSKWTEAAFIKEMIARLGVTATDFDKFVVHTTITKEQLQRDLALRNLLDGDFAAALKGFDALKLRAAPLHTDPFVIHINDCHDCDHETYVNAAWTPASIANRMATLAKTANGTGEAAAAASLELGNGLYNATWYGNARALTDESHEQTFDTRPAERWYKRAYDLTKDRELKAKAAFLAAKCERDRNLTSAPAPTDQAVNGPDPDVVPHTWYAVLKSYASTRYYKEVLKECGYFAAWTASGSK